MTENLNHREIILLKISQIVSFITRIGTQIILLKGLDILGTGQIVLSDIIIS